MIDLTGQIQLAVFSVIGILIFILGLDIRKLLKKLIRGQEEMTREIVQEEVQKWSQENFNLFFKNFSSAIEGLGAKPEIIEPIRTKTFWYQRWWVIALCFFAIACTATFFIAPKYFKPQKEVIPTMTFPSEQENVEVARVDLVFSDTVNASRLNIRVTRGQEDIPGRIETLNYKAVTWKPSNPITAPGDYYMTVTGEQIRIQTKVFHFRIKPKE